jgi:NO-binding membrane sensor protein with MHYT domain
MIEYGHNGLLVFLSLLVALVAGFTGLSLTKDLSSKSFSQRKIAVALASFALGGGIWSMHFVAMLGLQMPILFYYDAAITLVSALIAVLLVAVALGLLHFTNRTPVTIIAAGGITGFGILAMHYVGMAGLQLCRAVYTAPGLLIAFVAAMFMCIMAFRVAYTNRNDKNIVIGTVGFGGAVFSVHFFAMWGTNFFSVDQLTEFGPSISNEIMAIGVILTSFVILGAFLWVSATFLTPPLVTEDEDSDAPRTERIALPCESDGKRVFVLAQDVSFLRADGHYTQVYTDAGRLFCAWPITQAAKRLLPTGFIKVHRSYLVNPSKIARFERGKDKGSILFAQDLLPPVPVSRSKVKDVQEMMATQVGAIRAN